MSCGMCESDEHNTSDCPTMWIHGYWADVLPDWALRYACDFTELGTQLCTKDGRRCGNAVVVDAETSESLGKPVYIVLTDAGSIMTMTKEELKEVFHIPKYIMDPEAAPGWVNWAGRV